MRRLGLSAAIALLIFAAVLPQAFAQTLADSDRIATLHREAVSLYRAGHFDQAASRYQELIKLQPENRDLFRDLMWLWWRAEKPEQTAQIAAQATSRWPDNLEAWNLLGSSLAALDKKAEAAAAFEKSLKLDPEQLRVWRVVAQLRLDLEQYDQAERLINQVLKRHPEAKEFYPLLARAQTFQNKFPDAAKNWAKAREAYPEQLTYHYQEVAALSQSGQADTALRSLDDLLSRHQQAIANPENLKVWRLIAQLYLDMKQYEKAERVMTQVLQQHPQAQEFYPLLARAQTLQEKFSEAAQTWGKARQAYPEQLTYHYQEVAALSQSGQADAALRSLDDLVSRHQQAIADPEQLRVWRLATQLYLELERYAQAEQLVSQVLEHHPDAKEFYPLLARAQTFRKKWPEAAQSWAMARQAYPEQLSYHYQEISALSQTGQPDAVLKSLDDMVKRHQRTIGEPENIKVWRLVAQLYLDLGQFERSERLANQVLKRNPDAKELYLVLARAQTLQGKAAEAAQNWTKAREAFPDDPKYHYQEAMAMYQSGQTERAMKELDALVAKNPDFQPAVNMLVDQAIVHEDWTEAARLLEDRLAQPKPADSIRFLKLAEVYRNLGDEERFMAAIERCLELNPNQGEAVVLKAQHLEITGHPGAAAKAYRQVLKTNPWSMPALNGLAGVESAQGHHREAVKAIEQARKLDPRDPYLMLTHARLLNAQGDHRTSKRMLTEWLASNERTLVPVLLYHAIVTSSDDPLLAAPVHHTVAQFEDQIRGLRDAGYTPVTAAEVYAWYQGAGTLPAKPVLIAFDDARLDSFQNGDPILAKYNFKATMFTPITNVVRGLPGYASWDKLRSFQRTGRWEIQSHGSRASQYVQTDAEGHRGLFLVNRQWLPDENRMETEEEWRDRVANDYEEAHKSIADQLGTPPVAFAFPNNEFGQVGFPNVPDAAFTNLDLVGRVYGTAYHQSSSGINVRSEHPILLERMEPSHDWSGEDLVRHYEHRNPFVMMLVALTRHAAWQGRIREAQQWLSALEREGTPQALLMMEQARVHFAAGDPAQGRILVDRALQFDRSQEMDAIATSLREGDSRWNWSPSVSAHSDSNDRQSLTIDQQLGSFPAGKSLWSVNHRSGFYSEDDVDQNGVAIDDVMGHGAGLGVTRNLGLFHRWQASGMGHVFSGGEAGAAISAGTSFRSQWTDGFSTQVGVDYEPIETARALQADVREAAGNLRAEWKSDRPWDALANLRGASLSDDNTRFTTTFEVGRRLVEFLPAARVSYRFTFDDTANISENYYSPQQLMLHQVGLGYDLLASRILDLSVQYLPGFGSEQVDDVGGESATSFSQSFELNAALKWKGRPWLRPTIFLSDTPTYNSQRVGLRFYFRF